MSISGLYGCMAWKNDHSSPFWKCTDGDYDWVSVADDFGTLVAVSNFTNVRGY